MSAFQPKQTRATPYRSVSQIARFALQTVRFARDEVFKTAKNRSSRCNRTAEVRSSILLSSTTPRRQVEKHIDRQVRRAFEQPSFWTCRECSVPRPRLHHHPLGPVVPSPLTRLQAAACLAIGSSVAPIGRRNLTRKSHDINNAPAENTMSPGRRIHCQNLTIS